MNVGIQETEHFEGVYPVIRLFDNGRNKLFIFVSREVYLRLCDLLGNDVHKYHWVIQDDAESTFRFCIRIRKAILQKKVQLVYLNTISKHHLWYALVLPFRQIKYSILTVHDVNCLFKDKAGLNPRSWIKWLGKKLLAGRVSAFNTVSETVVPYLQQQASYNQPVYAIPGAVYERFNEAPALLEELKIVIPGSVDPKRRNYEAVLELAVMLKETKVQLCLLGGGNSDYASDIWSRCRRSGNSRLTWYETSVVNQDEFDRKLDAAHFIWIPSVVETHICGNIPETYGITKSSGNIFDIIKHARPFFSPQKLVVPGTLQDSCISYSHIDELAKITKDLLANPAAYAQLAAAAEKASAVYTLEKIRLRFAAVFAPEPGNKQPSVSKYSPGQ